MAVVSRGKKKKEEEREREQMILQNTKDKSNLKCSEKAKREGMSNARRLLRRSPGLGEAHGESASGGSEKESH